MTEKCFRSDWNPADCRGLQKTNGSKQHKHFIHCILFASRFSELFTTAVFKVPRLVKAPFLGSKCKLVLPELPTHRMRNANESRSAPNWWKWARTGCLSSTPVVTQLWGNLHRPAPYRHRHAPSRHIIYDCTRPHPHPNPAPPLSSRFHLKLHQNVASEVNLSVRLDRDRIWGNDHRHSFEGPLQPI